MSHQGRGAIRLVSVSTMNGQFGRMSVSEMYPFPMAGRPASPSDCLPPNCIAPGVFQAPYLSDHFLSFSVQSSLQ
jgi:hypothetical protein